MTLHNPALGVGLHIADVQVYNAAAPVAWTDLDLSAVVGTGRPALVMLKVKIATNGSDIGFRRKGDTDDFFFTVGANGSQGASMVSGVDVATWYTVFVCTDINGVIQICADAAEATLIDVMAWLA